MKKRLEAELISIAHRILKLSTKSEVDQLYLESKKLYETLAVLKFYGDNYEMVKNDIATEDIESKLEAFIDSPEDTPEVVVTLVPNNEEAPTEAAGIEDEVVEVGEITQDDAIEEVLIEEVAATIIEEKEVIAAKETLPDAVVDDERPENEVTSPDEESEEEVPMTEAKQDIDFEPIFELAAAPMAEEDVKETNTELEESKDETAKKVSSKQITFEDLLGDNYAEPVFVKPDNVLVPPSLKNVIEEQGKSLNEMHSKSINIGLNDKIAFVKHLFADSTEDYNRVLSQLNTFTSLSEAKEFIDEIIKPDYNNWEGVDDYAERFIAIVAKKFS